MAQWWQAYDLSTLRAGELPGPLLQLTYVDPMVLLVANCLKNCVTVRASDNGGQDRNTLFATTHPFASYVGNLMVNLAGGLFVSLFTLQPVPTFNSEYYIIAASVCWYLVNHSPLDIVWYVLNLKPASFVLFVLVEVRRMHNCIAGVARTRKIYASPVAWVIGGGFNAIGSTYMRSFEEAVRIGHPKVNELRTPSHITRVSLLFSVVFVACEERLLPCEPRAATALFVAYLCLLALARYASGNMKIDPLEHLFAPIHLLLFVLIPMRFSSAASPPDVKLGVTPSKLGKGAAPKDTKKTQ